MKGESMRLSRHLYWLFAIAMLPLYAKAQAPEIKVLVLDALNGKPQADVEVEYFCAGPPLNSAEKRVRTNHEGRAGISILCNDKQKIEISVFPSGKKEQCGGDTGMTANEVALTGFISKPDSAGNIWCPTKVSKKLNPVPGQVTIFVKKPTWWQAHVAG